jgi:hypothetical protein
MRLYGLNNPRCIRGGSDRHVCCERGVLVGISILLLGRQGRFGIVFCGTRLGLCRRLRVSRRQDIEELFFLSVGKWL